MRSLRDVDGNIFLDLFRSADRTNDLDRAKEAPEPKRTECKDSLIRTAAPKIEIILIGLFHYQQGWQELNWYVR